MRIDNRCSALETYEKVLKVNEKLNCVVTPIKPVKEGVAIALKDNVSTSGILTTASCKILDNYIPVYNATIVDKLEENGFVPVCKASMDELAMGGTNLTALTGPVKNPYDLTRISGGSSGGSAVLVASGAVSCAIGSDTGDSIRKPASYCGIVGVKPSYGRISRYGIIPYASSLDHVGYFTTCIEDACKLLKVLAGRDDKDMTSSFKEVPDYLRLLNADIRDKKILVFKNVVDAISDERVISLFNKVIDNLKDAGAIIEEVSFDDKLMKAILPTYYIIANAEATANHSNLDGINFGHREDGISTNEIMKNSRTMGFGPWIKKRFIIGSYALFEENQERILKKAHKIRRLIVDEVLSKLKDADILIAPASPSVAPKIEGTSTDELNDEYLIADNHMVIGNFGGLPSLTLPMGKIDDLPIGVNLTANAFDELTLFNVAKAIEDKSGFMGMTKEDF